jgi:hypothetical protein
MAAFAILMVEDMIFCIKIFLQDFDMRVKFLDSAPIQYEISRVVDHLVQNCRETSTKGNVSKCAHAGVNATYLMHS